MMLAIAMGLAVAVVLAIVVASYLSREGRGQPADLATGSNKPDSRNADGPNS